MLGTWRIGARLLTGPAAFALGGVVEAVAYWRGRARERLRGGESAS
jgi:hypothetical protein